MGNTKKALSVIINKLEDMQEAIDFISVQHDDELWEELVKQCLCKPEMVGVLLEHTVGNLDPLYIVKLVPNGLQIPRLRDRLVKIVTDYRTETSLRHGCNDILKTDCVNLLVKYYKEARHAVYLCSLEDEDRGKKANARDSQEGLHRPVNWAKPLNAKSRTSGGLRCCICFDALSVQNHSAIVFFCCHAYHIPCLADSSSDSVSNLDAEDGDEYEEEASSGTRRMRCILCTTAANLEDEDRGKKANARDSQEGLHRPVNGAKPLNVKSRTRGGLRCCICFDALSVQNHSAIVFFCCRAYHIPCLADSSSDSVSNSDAEDGDEYEEASSGGRRMRCILCTTAAK